MGFLTRRPDFSVVNHKIVNVRPIKTGSSAEHKNIDENCPCAYFCIRSLSYEEQTTVIRGQLTRVFPRIGGKPSTADCRLFSLR